MKRHEMIPSSLIILLVVSVAIAITARHRTKVVRSAAQEVRSQEEDKESVPIVDYSPSKSTVDRSDALRRVKCSRYNYRNKIVELPEGNEQTSLQDKKLSKIRSTL